MEKIIIDLFCGAGGESCGIHSAFNSHGEDIKLFAVNHWQRACETHARNFPHDECICQDIQTLIPTDLVSGGQEVELMWASPECTHFSVARGGKPMDDQSRCTPFDIIRWVTMLNIKRLIIENVPEFATWGPLDVNCRPIKEQKGRFFMMFISSLRAIGYTVDWRVCNAADFGAPTTRRRLFIQAVKQGSGKRLLWPSPMYVENPSDDLLGEDLKPWRSAADIIDWSIPCRAIDDRKKPLSKNTMARITNGIRKYWGKHAEPFLVRYNGGEHRHHPISAPVPTLDTSNRYGLVQPLIMEYYGNGKCSPVSNPLGTVTCKERFALLKPENCHIGFRMLQPHELAKAQSFPDWYQFTGTKTEIVKQIGNAVCPKMAEALVG